MVISRRCYERCVFGARRNARGAAGCRKKTVAERRDVFHPMRTQEGAGSKKAHPKILGRF